MKFLFYPVVIIFMSVVSLKAQTNSFWSTGMDMVFSFADIEANGVQGDALIRWAPVVNFHAHFNTDFNENLGFFTGFGIRNVGYTYNDYLDPMTNIEYKKKFRTYNLCMPFALKYGELSKWYIYAGYEIEFPFVYKEKTIDNGDKINKITGWFSSRSNNFQHGPFVGVRLPKGGNISFKYYISEFHNQDFEDSSGNKPYAGLNSNIFYFTVGYLFDHRYRMP